MTGERVTTGSGPSVYREVSVVRPEPPGPHAVTVAMNSSTSSDNDVATGVAPDASQATAPVVEGFDAVGDAADITDGRQRRRLRNIESVRRTILHLLVERERIDLDTVAARAGVAVRSIYRYYPDLESAVDDACQFCIAQIYARWDTFELPDPDAPLDQRIDQMLAQRIELEALGRPLRNRILNDSPDPRFDAEVVQVFEPELSQLDEIDRAPTTAALCFMLRPRGLRGILEFPQHDGLEARTLVAYSIRRLLGGERPS